MSQPTPTKIQGAGYEYVFTVSGITAGIVRVQQSASHFGTPRSTNGTFTETITQLFPYSLNVLQAGGSDDVELLTNGGFDDSTWWTVDGGSGGGIGSGVMSWVSSTDDQAVYRNDSGFLTVGNPYWTQFEIKSISEGGLRVQFGGGTLSETFTTTGIKTVLGIATNPLGGFFAVRSVGVTTATIDDISLSVGSPTFIGSIDNFSVRRIAK